MDVSIPPRVIHIPGVPDPAGCFPDPVSNRTPIYMHSACHTIQAVCYQQFTMTPEAVYCQWFTTICNYFEIIFYRCKPLIINNLHVSHVELHTFCAMYIVRIYHGMTHNVMDDDKKCHIVYCAYMLKTHGLRLHTHGIHKTCDNLRGILYILRAYHM